MTNLVITDLKENETLDGAEMRDVQGGILPFLIGGGIVAGAIGYAAYRFLVDDEPVAEVAPVDPAPMPGSQSRTGPLADFQQSEARKQATLNRVRGR